MISITLPRFVIAKATGLGRSYYWNPPVYWRKQAAASGREYPFSPCPLGHGLSQHELDAAAAPHNLAFDEWRQGALRGEVRRYAAHGTVEWLFEQYLGSLAFQRRVAERSRPDYRLIFDQVSAVPTKTGSTFGKLPISSVTPAAAEKIYSAMIEGEKYRRGEKALMYCKTAWKLMQPIHPREFRRDVPNPWEGVQTVRRAKAVKAAVTRDQVYTFAAQALKDNRPEAAAAAVICFEWLQRPENVIGGYVRWTDYTPGQSIRIEHHKTGEMVRHPLVSDDEEQVCFYADAEAVLARVPKRGVSIVVGPDDQQYKPTRFAQIVRKIADAAELPKHFTLDACRHGGMTELEEAELTDGQGRALSAHRSRAYEGYAKRTEKRVLSATKKRHAHRQG